MHKLVGDMLIEGGGVDLNATEEGVEARGDLRVQGVPAEVFWQRVFYAPDDRQPPIRVTATLDEATREQLGLKLNHLIKGPTPVTLSIASLGQADQTVNLQADLTEARLLFDNVGWTKPAGRAASVQFDLELKEDGSTDLQNFTILGDDIAVNGLISLDPEQHLKSFYFSALLGQRANPCGNLRGHWRRQGARHQGRRSELRRKTILPVFVLGRSTCGFGVR